MKFTKNITTLCLALLLLMQVACNNTANEGGETAAVPTSSGLGVTTLPSSALVVAEKNQIIAYNPDGNKEWVFPLPDNDTVATRPIAALSSTTYIRGTQGLYAIAPDGKTMWQAKHAGATDSIKGITPLSDSTVAITIGDNSLVGFNPQGQPKWTFKMPEGEKISAAPALAASSIVYLRSAKKIYAIDSQGNLAWTAEIGESAKK